MIKVLFLILLDLLEGFVIDDGVGLLKEVLDGLSISYLNRRCARGCLPSLDYGFNSIYGFWNRLMSRVCIKLRLKVVW